MCRHLSPRILVCMIVFLCAIPVLAQSYGDLPLSFEPNLGQSDSQVQFLSHGKGYGFFLSGDAAVLQLGSGESRTLRLRVADGKRPDAVSGEERLPGLVNYFQGSDEGQWLRNVPTYRRVRMADVYPGVDLVYYGNHRQLEYDFVVHAGADATAVGLVEEGADQMTLGSDGSLTIGVGTAEVRWHAPVAYQEINGERQPVEARYEIAGATFHFVLGAYDHRRDLVIDPVLVYSTYLGGNGGDVGDVGNAIAVDAAGNAYIAGLAASTNFPTTGKAMQPATHGNDDAFVAKLNPQGTAFVYSTYLGGGGQDIAFGIAVDAAGEAFVTGQTGSGLHGTSSFPTTAGAYQRTHNAGTMNNSAFVTKLSANGADLLYSTLLSGANDAFATGIALDGSENAYLVISTASGFPVTGGAYQKTAGTHACSYEQFADGQSQVVTKLNASGSALAYSTYVGHGCDYGAGIAVNAAGEAFITGHTQDSAYPVTARAAQGKFGGVVDGFVTRLNANGSGLIYSTFLGGPMADFSNAIALDSAGYAYVAGGTDGGFPTSSGAYQAAAINNGYRKGFVTKINPQGTSRVYSTYIKGASNVSFNGIAVDKSHNVYVTGYTDGKQYPATSAAVQGSCYVGASGCLTQAVVSELNAAGAALLYSSYFGASDSKNNYFPGNLGNGIAVDNAGGFYITGRTSNGLKTTAGVAEPAFRANSSSTDAFVVKFNMTGTASSATQVKILSPANGAVTTTSVHISATAQGGAIAAMQVYVDSSLKARATGSAVNTMLVLAVGQHRITAQAFDQNGNVTKSTIFVTVK